MTALMYKKPDDHIQFLGECLSKVQEKPKIHWHSFIEPLPPIPTTGDKIHSESEQIEGNGSLPDLRKLASPPLQKTSPLPPIPKAEKSANDGVSSRINNNLDDNLSVRNSSPLTSLYSFHSIDDDEGLEEKNLSPREVFPDEADPNVLKNGDPEAVKDLGDSNLVKRNSVLEVDEGGNPQTYPEIKPPVIFVLG